MERSRIDHRISTKALAITAAGVQVDAGDTIKEIPADTIVIADGSKPLNSLSQALEKKGIPFRTTGDADHVAQAIDAIHIGFAVGKSM